MYICAAGDIHGAMNKLYDEVQDFEASLGIRFDFVLHVGDFSVWPDPTKIDKGTRNHEGVGDFPAWLESRRAAPRRTVFPSYSSKAITRTSNGSTRSQLRTYYPMSSIYRTVGRSTFRQTVLSRFG
jgi:hypothetical protein